MKILSIKRAAGAAAAVLMASSAALTAMPTASAYNGVEDPNTGIVWGIGQDGSYMVPLASGGEVQGWCIDPGAAYPKQPGPYGSMQYGAPEPWVANMSDVDKKRVAVAMILGKGIETGVVNPQIMGMINQVNGALDQAQSLSPIPLNLPHIPTDVNALAAGASGVIHAVGDANRGVNPPPYTKAWNPNRLAPQARQVYDLIMNFSNFIPNQMLPYVDFSIRRSLDNGRQRMVTMNDIKINWEIPFQLPEIKLPPIDIPDLPDVPVTPPTTTPPTTPVKPPTTPPAPNPEQPGDVEKPTPEIRTTAGTVAGNVVAEGATITDRVMLSKLTAGEQYRLTGVTVNKDTQQHDGNIGRKEFTADSAAMTVDVPIAIKQDQGADLVVFEALEHKNKSTGKWEVIARHEDITDKAQTIRHEATVTPELRTSAESNTGNVIQDGSVVTDTVHFKNVTPGEQYRLEAELVCQATGESTGATQTVSFTPEAAEGDMKVEDIRVTDPSCLTQVVFEKLYDKDNTLVAYHADLHDQAQTFGGEAPQAPAPKQELVRKIITSVPSGAEDGYGRSLF